MNTTYLDRQIGQVLLHLMWLAPPPCIMQVNDELVDSCQGRGQPHRQAILLRYFITFLKTFSRFSLVCAIYHTRNVFYFIDKNDNFLENLKYFSNESMEIVKKCHEIFKLILGIINNIFFQRNQNKAEVFNYLVIFRVTTIQVYYTTCLHALEKQSQTVDKHQ